MGIWLVTLGEMLICNKDNSCSGHFKLSPYFFFRRTDEWGYKDAFVFGMVEPVSMFGLKKRLSIGTMNHNRIFEWVREKLEIAICLYLLATKTKIIHFSKIVWMVKPYGKTTGIVLNVSAKLRKIIIGKKEAIIKIGLENWLVCSHAPCFLGNFYL